MSLQSKNVLSMNYIQGQFNEEYYESRLCRTDHLTRMVMLVAEHISNLIAINEIQVKVNTCYARYHSFEEKLQQATIEDLMKS